MQFNVETTDANCHRFPKGLFEVAEAFLNVQFGARYYGPGLTHIAICFKRDFPKRREAKAMWRYKGSFAEHLFAEAEGEDVRNSELTAIVFHQFMDQILQRILSTRPLWPQPFCTVEFQRDFTRSLTRAPNNDADLRKYASEIELLRRRGRLEILRGTEEHRFQLHRPCDVPFRGLRCYECESLEGVLQPHVTTYSQLLEGVLRNLGLMCPVYREIYINIAESLEDARYGGHAIEEWHENAYAVISRRKYELAAKGKRARLVFDALADSLRDLAKIDHLDIDLIEQSIAKIQETGIDTDMEYLLAENKHYTARVLYRVSGDGGDPAFRLEVHNKADGRAATVDLGRHDLWWLPYRFGRLVLRAEEVIIESRKSQRALVSIKADKFPARLRYRFKKIFGG